MNGEKPEVKRRILQATIELIREVQAFEKVSMRKVAEKAGVAVSMVNYHFQTKENLINQAVQSFIAKIIAASETAYGGGSLVTGHSSVENMGDHLKSAASFMAAHPGISRVSILSDMQRGSSNDNTSQIIGMVSRQLAGIYPDWSESAELKVLARMQVAAVQQLFLRAELNKQELGLDFFDEEQRGQLMDMVIDAVIGCFAERQKDNKNR